MLALFSRLNTVIDGIANHMHQRVTQLLHDELVDFRFSSGDHQADLFAQLSADLAYDPS